MAQERYLRFQVAENHPAYPPRVHYHPDIEVYYLLSGSCRYFIDRCSYRLTAGDMVLVPPGAIHKVVYESPTHSRLLFNCPEDLLPPSVRPYLDRLTHFPASQLPQDQLQYLFTRLREAAPGRFYKDTIQCLAGQLFLLMASQLPPQAPSEPCGSIAEQAILYIHQNYSSRITLTQAAAHCAVSPEHLSRTFKKEIGFGFNEYLSNYRLEKAEALLKNGTVQTVAQAALSCGFNDSNYFSSAYKRYHGISPSKIRK